jgi:hypothetical protein
MALVAPQSYAQAPESAASKIAAFSEDGDSGHWVALNLEYIEEVIESYKETLAPQEWDSQYVIQAKIAQLKRVVKALKFLAHEKSRLTFKALAILGYTDTNTATLKPLIANHLKEFAMIQHELEKALRPDLDDSDLDVP